MDNAGFVNKIPSLSSEDNIRWMKLDSEGFSFPAGVLE